MIITDTATSAFEKLSMDIVGPLPLTVNGNQYILTVQDNLTKFLYAQAMPVHDAASITTELINVFCMFGFPQIILTNNCSDFCSTLMKNFTNEFGIKKLVCSPYHPKTNGSI